MALDVVQFVDSIAASPTVRLDLNNENPWAAPYEGADFSPPRLRRAVASTLLRDGATYPASAYDDRVLKLRLELKTSTVDGQAAALQALAREVDRPTNFLRWQPAGMTNPVFFRTIRSDMASVKDYPGPGTFRTVDVELLAEPFAYGLPETLPAVIISNDPADRFPLNANPYFETDASNWTPAGGTFVRSTAQFHQGAASGLLTPDGVSATAIVRSELCPNLLEGFDHRASAWVRCAVARNVRIGIAFHDHTGAFVSQPTAAVAVAANTWTFIDVVGTAPTVGGPVDKPQAKVVVEMDGTPLASHLLYVDEAKIRDQESGNGPGGLCWDITGVKGDVETPPVIALESPTWTADRQILLGVRRRDTTDLQLVKQAEDAFGGEVGPDTTVQTGDTAMSRGGYLRTTFATPTMVTRWTAFFGAFGTANTRGRYRVFARYRKTVASDVIRVQLRWAVGKVTNRAVTLPASTDIRYVDLGVFTQPTFNDPVTHPLTGVPVPTGLADLEVQEARDSGTGNLDIDCLVIVPAAGPITNPGSERLALITVGGFPVTVDAVNELVYYWDLFGDIVTGGPQPAVGMFPLLNPGVTNRMYLMANAGLIGPADSLLDTTTVTVSYSPRYLNVRPVST